MIFVHLLIAAHITHWLVTGRTVTPVEPSEAMAYSREGIVNAGLIFFVVAGLLTAIFGRFICGWACHLVVLQDMAYVFLSRIGVKPKPLRSRLLMVVPTIAFLWVFILPAALRLWREKSLGPRHYELTTDQFWQTFPGWFVGGMTFFVCGFVVVYFLGAKGFCTYACPYGALFGAAEKISPFRIRVTDSCEGCGHCTAVCTSNVRVHEEVRDYGMVVDPGCMKCMDCVSVCPNDALYYGFGKLPFQVKPEESPREARKARRSLPLSEEIVLGVGFAVGYACLRNLYGGVPYLFALGLGTCVAFCALTAWRLARQKSVSFRRYRLKAAGKLLPHGRAAVGLLAALVLFLTHSAWMRVEMFRGERLYRDLIGPITAAAAAAEDPELSASLAPEAETRVEQALLHYGRIARYGLFDGIGPLPRRAWLEFLDDNDAEAERLARIARERNQLPWEMSQLIGSVAARRGDFATAVNEFQAAYEERASLEAATRLGAGLARLGRLPEARTTLIEAEKRFGPSAQSRFSLGLIAAMQGDLEAARQGFQNAISLEPDFLPALENLAGIEASLGRFEEARALFVQALEANPQDIETRFLLARVLLELGRNAEAAQELETIVEQSPEATAARRMLDQIRIRLR
ncbi:MAG: tetratricopeptide repeat protein [Acidobacteriota bacterium]